MASIKNLKKDVNNILADIIEDCLIWQLENPKADASDSEKIINDTIEIFDSIILRINKKDIADKKGHFRSIVTDLKESTLTQLDRVIKL